MDGVGALSPVNHRGLYQGYQNIRLPNNDIKINQKYCGNIFLLLLMTLSGIACCTFTCGATASIATAGYWRWCAGAWRSEPSMLPTTRPRPASFHDSPVSELALVSMSAVLTTMAMWPILLKLSRWEGGLFEPVSACLEEKVYNYHYMVCLLWGVQKRKRTD